MSDPLQAKRIELILQQLDQLPTLPAVAIKVLEATADSESNAKEVIQLISSDMSLTTRILQLVHNSTLGVRGEVKSIDRAVVLLGFDAVRSAVLAVSVFETLQSSALKSAVPGMFSREEFWKHCVAVACSAELIAQALIEAHGPIGGITPSEAFVCGLLHDIGKVALDAVLPKSFAKVVEAADLLRANIADLERSVIGLDHTIVGKRLAERWQLPVTIRECIWLHGQHPQAIPASAKNAVLVNIVTLADLIAREQHLGYSGNYVFSLSRDEVVSAVGLTPQALDAKLVPLLERIEERAAVLNLHVANTHDLYQQAMKRANQELGRVSTQLALKNRRLQTRGKFFDALSSFQGQLRPDSSPQSVIGAIGQTAVGVLQVGALAVFSLPPGQNFAEALLFDEAGEVFETTLVDCASHPRPAPGGDGPVLSAGEELDWLLSAIGPRLTEERKFWIPLDADGQVVGGVVWGAPTGESQRLGAQAQELGALAGGWRLALRMAQIRDETRLLAEQLAQANQQLQTAQGEIQRNRLLLSVGEMAAGAAHEMNNPLTVIAGRSQLLASQLTDARHQALASMIHEQSNRLSQIITELMDYAKPTPPTVGHCDIAELLERALHDAKAQADCTDRAIEVTFSEVPPICADEKQVAAALTEVIANALIATEHTRGHVEVHAASDPISRRVAVTITDDGPGMDSATLGRAFDPFFSSKPAGRRRGLGLAKAQRWIEGSGGSIKLESRPGHGTRAVILLPAASVAAPSETMSRKAL